MGKTLGYGEITVANMTEPFTVMLTNEAQQFATDSNRKVTSAQSYYTDIIVIRGSQERTDYTIGNITSGSGITVSKSSKRVTFSVSAGTTIGADTGVIEIPITLDGQTVKKQFSWSCGKQGPQGVKGEDGSNFAWNLLKGTGTAKEFTPKGNLTNQTTLFNKLDLSGQTLKEGDKFVISCDLEWTQFTQGTSGTFDYWFQGSVDYSWSYDNIFTQGLQKVQPTKAEILASDGKKHLSAVCTMKQSLLDKKIFEIGIRFDNTDGTGKIKISNLKIAKEDKESPWCLHPDELKGATGDKGKSVQSVIEYYLATSASTGVTTSTSGWSTDPTTQKLTAEKKYLWNCKQTVYDDGTRGSITSPVICGTYGDKGQNAKNLTITPSSQYFKSTDGGKTFAPNTITIRPTIQGEISFGKWQYSIDGGVSFADVVSGQKGLTISNNVLTVSKDSSLYSDAVTMVTFRAVASDSSFYDTCSIAKIYDVSDIGDGRNLLWNSNFAKTDEAITGTTNSWGLHTRGTNLVASIDTSTKHNGFNTLKTVSAANGDKNSSNDLEWFAWGISERTSDNLHSKNQNYTLSFYAKASVTTDFIVRWGYDAYGADTTRTLTTNWQKYEIKLHQATSAYSITIIFKLLTAGTVWFSEFKLEKGSSATGYSTAPEDLQTAILSTKSEISDVSLKVDKNKQAIEQRVEKTTYQQDLNLVKGDISKANEGLNKWRYEIYPKSLFTDKPEDQSKYDIGVFIRNKNLTPSRTLVFDDNKWTLLDYENNYIGYGLTFVKMSAKKTFSTKWAHSSSCSIYVNGKLIISDEGTVRLDSNNTGRDFSCTFIEGWNCIEFVMQETTGNEWFFFKDAISTISECQLMNCYYGTPVARQSHITNQLVENTTNIKGISTKVSKVTSVIGEDGKNFTDFKNDYSDFKQTMNGFKTTVGQTYVTKDDFDGLQIGGRNLLLYSANLKNGYYTNIYDTADETFKGCSVFKVNHAWNGIRPYFNKHITERNVIKAGDVLTYSVYAKTDDTKEIDIMMFNRTMDNDSGQGAIRGNQRELKLSNDWKLYSVTFKVAESMLSVDKGLSWFGYELCNNTSSGKYVYFACPKLENSNKPTDWTPAPEDVNGKIVNVETIANQTAKQFEWIVKGGDSSSNFTLTDRVADLVAERINFKGLVTFSGLNTDAKNEIGKVAQSKVDGLQIGGRNLLVQKNITEGYLSTDGKGSFVGSGGGDQTSDWIDVSGNKYITVTLYEDFTNTNNSGRYCEYDADKNCINTVVYNPRQKSSIIIELKSNTKYIRVTAIECKTRRYKIEAGNKATDWTPAPEDYLPQADLVSNWTTNTTWIDGGKIYTGSITADKIAANSITADKIATDAIKSRNYISSGGTQGSFLNLSDGSFTSPNLSWDSNGNLIASNANLSGLINATKGTVGGWNIATNGLYSGIDENAIKIYSATTYDAQTMYQKQKIQDSFILSQKYINHFVSQQVSVGHNIPYWQTRSFIYNDSQIQLAQSDYCINTSSASNYDAQYSLKDGYISATRIYMEQNITQVGGDVINSSFSIGLDSMMGWCSIQSTKGINIYGNSSRALYVQSNDTSKYNALETEGDVVVNGKIHAVSGDNKIQLNSDNNGSIELYGNTPFIDFHSAYSSADYTCRIIANTPEQLLVCGKLRCDSNIISNNDLIANSWVYAGQNAHYTWQNQLDCYFSCGYYNNTNNVYYYAGYHAFYVNNDSGSGMMYINTNGVTSRVGFTKTSDERIKKNFESFDDNIIDAYMNIEPVKYQLKQSSNDNYHFGFKAQHVDKVFSDYGDTYNESFDICTSRPIDPDKAKELYGVDDMTEEYGLRYDELIAPTTYMVQHIYKELESTKGELAKVKQEKADLETRLQAIEAKLRL